MQTITISTYLDASAERIWGEVNAPRLLFYVAHPLIRFVPIKPDVLPDRWVEGHYIVKMRLLGVLPLGKQTIGLSTPPGEGDVRFIRDNGHSAMIRRWNHLISITPDGDGTRYTDRVEIDAGVLTPVVALFARAFYRHRQRRWRRLVSHDFDYGSFSRCIGPSA